MIVVLLTLSTSSPSVLPPPCVSVACTKDCIIGNASNPRGNCCGNLTTICRWDDVFNANRCMPPPNLMCSDEPVEPRRPGVPAPPAPITLREHEAFMSKLFSANAAAYDAKSPEELRTLYAADLEWVEDPRQWHQQVARIVDHRFKSFTETASFVANAKKAGVGAVMLVSPNKMEACPGGWYNGLQLCDHINGSFPASDGTLAEWQQMVAEAKPMRLMWWINPTYWSIQGEVWAQANASKTSDVGKFFTWNLKTATEDQCFGSNPFGGGGYGFAQGSWGEDGSDPATEGIQSAMATWGSKEYADYMVDAMANSWTKNLAVDGYTVDCAANYNSHNSRLGLPSSSSSSNNLKGDCSAGMQQCGGDAQGAWAKIVDRVRAQQPQLVLSGESFGSWAEVIHTSSQIGGQGFADFHTATQRAVRSGDASTLEDVVSTTGADAATVLCYMNPAYDGKQPGACPTMYFRDSTASGLGWGVKEHEFWIALEAGSGIVPEHDFDPASSCLGFGSGCETTTGAWWNVTNDPFETNAHNMSSPLWAFQKYRALNRVALRTKLGITSSSSPSLSLAAAAAPEGYMAHVGSNCYTGNGGVPIDVNPLANAKTLPQCATACDGNPQCDCFVWDAMDAECYRREVCDPTKFEHDAASAGYTTYTKSAPVYSNYTEYPSSNAYQGHGGKQIDSNPETGLTVAQCMMKCDADVLCDCVTFSLGTTAASSDGEAAGNCWKRAQCMPVLFDHSDSSFATWVKKNGPTPGPPVAGGALAYLKHDSMGPHGDACLMLFNPGAAQTITVDLSSLPTALMGTKPYDLLAYSSTGTQDFAPALAATWTVPMAKGEVRAFGGFSLGVWAPRAGKKASCKADDGYAKAATGTTLEACFLECASDVKCANVFLEYIDIKWMETPPPAKCTLLGALADPSTACVAGRGTLVHSMKTSRGCAHRWKGERPPPAPGAPAVAEPLSSPRCD